MLEPLTERGRYERKFNVHGDPAAARERFVAAGAALGYRPDEHSTHGSYALASLYFDTPELHALQANADGDYFHVKFRIRAYAPSDTLFYEIKYKQGDVIFKRRRRLPAHAIEPELCRREFRALVLGSGSAALVSPYVLRLLDRLAPVAVVRYRRTALVGFPEERLCLDQALAFGPPQVDTRLWFGELAPADARLSILEVKAPPHAVRRSLLAMGSLAQNHISRFSKYCEAVTWLRADPAAYGANPYVGLKPHWSPESSAGFSMSSASHPGRAVTGLQRLGLPPGMRTS